MTTVSEYLGLSKSHSQLDFVDVPLDGDFALFAEAFALTLRHNRWSQKCAMNVQGFFRLVIDLIRNGDELKELSS